MPLRASTLTNGLQGLGSPGGLRIYDRHAWGRLLRFHMLDTRQYRDRQACRPPESKLKSAVDPRECPELLDPARSMLGTEQEHWIEQGLAQDAASAVRWSVLAQQTIFALANYQPLPEEIGRANV